MNDKDWQWARAVIEMDAEPDSIGSAAREALRRHDALAARLDEVQQLLRGVAQDATRYKKRLAEAVRLAYRIMERTDPPDDDYYDAYAITQLTDSATPRETVSHD